MQKVPLPYPSPIFHEVALAFCAKGQASETMHKCKDRTVMEEEHSVLVLIQTFLQGTQNGEGTSYPTANDGCKPVHEEVGDLSSSLWNLVRSLKPSQICASSEL